MTFKTTSLAETVHTHKCVYFSIDIAILLQHPSSCPFQTHVASKAEATFCPTVRVLHMQKLSILEATIHCYVYKQADIATLPQTLFVMSLLHPRRGDARSNVNLFRQQPTSHIYKVRIEHMDSWLLKGPGLKCEE